MMLFKRQDKYDERYSLSRAILKGGAEDNDEEVISQLLKGLRESGVDLRTAIEHGCGVNAVPAATFVKNGVSYQCIDMNSELLYYFKDNLRHFPPEISSKVKINAVDISKIHLKKAFEGVERPLLVLFYHSFEYLLRYATSTHLARKLAEKKLNGRKFSSTIERISTEATEMEKSHQLILPTIVKKYYNFLNCGDAMVCISGTEPNLIHPYVACTGAEIFYEFARRLKWSRVILLTLSYEKAKKEAAEAYAKCFERVGRGDEQTMQNRLARINEIDNRKEAIIGVICIK